MVPLDRLQSDEPADCQSFFVSLAAVYKGENMLRQDLSGLRYDRLIARL
jgi:hypothetical protein